MKIGEWMTRTIHSVKPLDSIGHAREILEKHRVNQLPVVLSGRVVGIVTDRDLRDASPSVFQEARGRRRAENASSAVTVEEVMSSGVLTVSPTDSVADAARLMRRERIGSVPVVDGDRLVGILTRSDLLSALIGALEGGVRTDVQPAVGPGVEGA